jgi:hypothetical protein
VVEVSPPDAARSPYARVRLWIAQKVHMVLQAEGLDAQGAVIRRLWVKSFMKVDDRWMIKTMEIESAPFDHRARLSIREVDGAVLSVEPGNP